MNERPKRRPSGQPYHSILADHYDFIRQLRQQHKTWREIAKRLWTEKGIRVTLYAPYRFCQRKSKHGGRPHWEEQGSPRPTATTLPKAISPATGSDQPSTGRPSPLPPKTNYRRPNMEELKKDEFL